MMINVENWKEFKPKKLFELVTISNKLGRKDLIDDGITPVYSSTTVNNGIEGFTNKSPDFIVDDSNPVYLVFGDHTKAMDIVRTSFCVMDNVKVLRPKYNDDDIIRFICIVWQKTIPNLGYSRHWSIAKKTNILLPVNHLDELDVGFIKKYMSEEKKKCSKIISNLDSISTLDKNIDISKWEKFKVGELFPNIVSPKVYHVRHVTEDEDGIPYVVRTKFNNGVKYKVTKENDFITNPGGTISFGAENSTFFYQAEEFISGRDMYYIDTRSLSKECALFVATCLQKITDKYSYNYGLFPNLLKEEYIKLPVDSDGNPDWNYMERYIKSLPYGRSI